METGAKHDTEIANLKAAIKELAQRLDQQEAPMSGDPDGSGAATTMRKRNIPSTENPLAKNEIEWDADSSADGNLMSIIAQSARSAITDNYDAPCNLHQVTAYVTLSPSASTGRKVMFLSISFGLVVLQSITSVAISQGTAWPSCTMHSHCHGGDYCKRLGLGMKGCGQCLHNRRDDPEWHHTNHIAQFAYDALERGDINASEAWNATLLCSYSEEFLASLGDDAIQTCEGCRNPQFHPLGDGHALGDGWSGRTDKDAGIDAVQLMTTGDYAALLLVSIVVATAVVREVRDIMLCETLILQQGAAAGHDQAGWISPTLWLLTAMRRFCFMPCLIMAIPFLLIYRGSTAIDICFNALSVLFMCDIDNCIYFCLLSATTRKEMETNGRLAIDSTILDNIGTTSKAHGLLIPFALMISVVGINSSEPNGTGYSVPFIVMGCGAVAEALVDKPSAAKRILFVMVGLGVGFVSFAVFFVFVELHWFVDRG